MKKSKLIQLIKEEINNIMNEDESLPKEIEIAFTDRDNYNNITVDGKVMKKKNGIFKIDVEEAEKYLEKITGMEKIDLQYINYFELKELLKKIEEKLAEKGIEFTSREDMNVD